MGKKNKKSYKGRRVMRLVCIDCKCLWKDCDCPPSLNTDAWVYVDDQELEHYFKTGLVPDHKALIMQCEGEPLPEPVPLVHPPQYGFKI